MSEWKDQVKSTDVHDSWACVGGPLLEPHLPEPDLQLGAA